MARSARPASALALALAASTAPSRLARADPQGTVGVVAGGALEHGAGSGSGSGVQGAFQAGARADLLQRANPRALGGGGYVDVAVSTLGHGDAGGGGELLLPVTDDLPLVLGVGAFARDAWGPGGMGGVGRAGRWAPGVEASLFFGSRSFNYHGAYGLTAGLVTELRCVPGPGATVEGVAALQIDLEILALPWIFAWEALTH